MFGNPLLLGDDGYQISRSVRLRSSASAYLSRTFGTPTNNLKWTWSAWIKRGILGGTQCLFHGNGDNTVNRETMIMLDGDAFRFYNQYNSVNQGNIVSTAVLRDPSAWYHLMLVFDSAQATAANRVLFYVNGVQLTSFSTNSIPPQNQATYINANTNTCYYGYRVPQNDLKFDGYITEANFIDGQALTPSSFGETDAVTGVWKPKKYTGTYGTNGFYLNFSDNSAATAAAIGKDSSGNGNNWTPNNISVTAGATYDSMIDVPTLWGDGGNGRGNYATLNPLFNTSGTLSNANLTLAGSSITGQRLAGISVSSGKWYYEVTCTSLPAGSDVLAGFSEVNTALVSQYPGQASTSYSIYTLSTNTFLQKANNASFTNTNTAKAAQGDIIGVALDLDNGKIWFSKNNTFVDSGDPAAGTNAQYTSITGTYAPAFRASGSATSNSIDVNFGQRPFTYTPPSGFKALNTFNLPAPTISNGALYMAATIWTGDGTNPRTITNTVNGVSFKPDLVWTKARSQAYDHSLYDSVRGATNYLISNSTAAEASAANSLQAFNSNGFQVGGNNYTNSSSATYVGWQWKKGATQGFDIVTFTGDGSSPKNIAHSLGVAPKMIIIKSRNNVSGWNSYHASLGNTQQINLQSTAAAVTSIDWWNNTSPTSSQFTIGANINLSGWTFVAYLFAEVAGFSKFGSYTGNGSTDGPFVYLGFRPRYLLVKRTDAAGYNWIVWDSARDTYNQEIAELYPSLPDAEGNSATNGRPLDFLSNGFKWRGTNAIANASGGTYIYAAFAENPFKYSLAR